MAVRKKSKKVNNKLELLKIKVLENEFRDLILRNYFFSELNFIIESYNNGYYKLNEVFEAENNRKKGAKEKTERLNKILAKKIKVLEDINNKYSYLSKNENFLEECIYIVKTLKLNKVQYLRIYEKNYYNNKKNKKIMNPYTKLLNYISKLKHDLLAYNRFLVVSIAKKYSKNCTISIEDLVNEGLFGLIKAINMVDPLRNIELSTYSYNWIKLYIGRAIINQSKLIRVPVYIIELINRVTKLSQQHFNDFNEEPTDEDLLQYDKIDEKVLNNVKQYKYNNISSIECCSKDIALDYSHEDYVIKKTISEEIRECVLTLDDLEKEVLNKEFNLGLFLEKDLSKDLPKYNIAIIKQRAMDKLKDLLIDRGVTL